MATRMQLIDAGVRNLKEFGYPDVDRTNILAVDVFKAFFKSMLEDNLGKGSDKTINELLAELGAP